MGVDYSIKTVIGQRVDLDDFFEAREGITSCKHNPPMDAPYCASCGKRIVVGPTYGKITEQGRRLFGDRSLEDLKDDSRSPTPDPLRIQPIDIRLTGDSDPAVVVGILLKDESIPDSTRAKQPGGFAPSYFAETAARVEAKLREAGLEPKVEIFIAPYVSY